jgi:hypothetical protein
MKSLILMMFVLSTNVFAGEKGNGGDIIRAAFIAAGEKIITTIEDDSNFSAIAKKKRIDVQKLRSYLNTEFIKISEKQLIDNTGSVVDALGSSKAIILDRISWRDYVLKSKFFKKLVFHELLRAAEIEDDNFVVSSKFDFLTNPPEDENLDYKMSLIREVYESLPVTDRKRTSEILNMKKNLTSKKCSIHNYNGEFYDVHDFGIELESYLNATYTFFSFPLQFNLYGPKAVKTIFNHSDFGMFGYVAGENTDFYLFPRFSSDLKTIVIEYVVQKFRDVRLKNLLLPRSLSVPNLDVERYMACELE